MKPLIRNFIKRSRLLDLEQLQWAVPGFLSLTALIFEYVEHKFEDESIWSITFISETMIFGLMGPILVGFIIAWMRKLVDAEKSAVAEIHQLNRELELKVIERTAALEERNLELARANA